VQHVLMRKWGNGLSAGHLPNRSGVARVLQLPVELWSLFTAMLLTVWVSVVRHYLIINILYCDISYFISIFCTIYV
jgi:hypothetical protein